jgi:Uma2 family endonuclease
MVRVSDQRYYYPDLVIACDPSDAHDRMVSIPCFVVEITSPTTRSTDLREKVPAYRDNRFLRGFLIVEQKRRRVFSYRRTEAGEWDGLELTGSGTLAVPCADATLSLDEIYEGLDLPRMTVREGEDEYTIEEYEEAWAHHDAFIVLTKRAH